MIPAIHAEFTTLDGILTRDSYFAAHNLYEDGTLADPQRETPDHVPELSW